MALDTNCSCWWRPYVDRLANIPVRNSGGPNPRFNLSECVAGTMGEQMIEEYMAQIREEAGSGIMRPSFGTRFASNLRVNFSRMKEPRENTFSGTKTEDANEHIDKILSIVNLFHKPDVNEDQLMLRVFPMTLIDQAYRWLKTIHTRSITTWNSLIILFLHKYCPPSKTDKKMKQINNFKQEPDETLYRA
ncbi:ribonuclease H-like domain-containing protein [Tanacetum coccineum]